VRTDVVFATMTLARSTGEGVLLARSLERLASYGRPVVAADGGSTPEALARLSSLRGVEVMASRGASGLVGQIQTSLGAAARHGTPFVCYTEPDKEAFFTSGLAPFLDAAPRDPDVGVVIAARSPASFDTFPPLQQYTEQAINDLVGEVVGIRGDYSYGPFVMSARVVPHVLALGLDVGWGWRHFAFVTAHRLGLRVVVAPGHYDCPADQRDENDADRMHRVKQLEQNSRGLSAAIDQPLTSRAD
jgi:hypothetical protein